MMKVIQGNASAWFRDRFCYTPNERRRLARADSGPGRRFPRRIPRARPLVPVFSRHAMESALFAAVPGLRSRHLTITEPSPFRVVAMVPAWAVNVVRLALDPITPLHVAVNVEPAPEPR